jgi:DNA-binding response OmpR family regulator
MRKHRRLIRTKNTGRFDMLSPAKRLSSCGSERNYGNNIFSRGKPMRILLVEDDKKIASFVARGLREAGFAVDHADDGKNGLELALCATYDTIIVDLMLPRLDGLSIVDELRRQKIHTPVIILSAKRSVDDRIAGLQHGGDDYLVKPFSFAELLARVQALIRRATHETEPTRLLCGELSLDLLTRQVTRAGQKIELQPREFSLLEYLMRNAGRVVSKTMIMEQVWGYDFDPQTNVVDVLVSRLRHKVDRDFETKLIHTHRGVGYALRVS